MQPGRDVVAKINADFRRTLVIDGVADLTMAPGVGPVDPHRAIRSVQDRLYVVKVSKVDGVDIVCSIGGHAMVRSQQDVDGVGVGQGVHSAQQSTEVVVDLTHGPLELG